MSATITRSLNKRKKKRCSKYSRVMQHSWYEILFSLKCMLSDESVEFCFLYFDSIGLQSIVLLYYKTFLAWQNMTCVNQFTVLMSQCLLCCLDYVPTAAVIHVWPFLCLLTGIHCLICVFAKLSMKTRHVAVHQPAICCRSRPMTVRVTSVSMMTAITHVAVTLQNKQFQIRSAMVRLECWNLEWIGATCWCWYIT